MVVTTSLVWSGYYFKLPGAPGHWVSCLRGICRFLLLKDKKAHTDRTRSNKKALVWDRPELQVDFHPDAQIFS